MSSIVDNILHRSITPGAECGMIAVCYNSSFSGSKEGKGVEGGDEEMR